MIAKQVAKLCKRCMYYREEEGTPFCALMRDLIPPDWKLCADYAPILPSENIDAPKKTGPPTHVSIKIGGVPWQQLYNGLHALHHAYRIEGNAVIRALEALEPGAKSHPGTVRQWEKERCRVRVTDALVTEPFCRQAHWREALDALREQFINREIDMDTVLAALDPQDAGSESVSDLIHTWETELWSKIAKEEGLEVARAMSGNPDLPF